MLLLCELDTNEAREFHNRQRAFGITSDARMYVARADLEEREGHSAKALKILQEGLRIGAGPADILTTQIAALHTRLPKHSESELQQILEPLEAQTEAHDTTIKMDAGGSSGSMSKVVGVEERHRSGTQTAQTCVDGSTQTEFASDEGRPGRRWTRKLSAHKYLQRWLGVERRRCLLSCFAGWKGLVDTSAQERREALFDSLRGQLDLAQRRCRAAEHCLAKGQLDARATWFRLALRAWYSLAQLCSQKKKLADAAYQEVVRHSASLVLWAWQRMCFPAARIQDTVCEAAVEPAASLDSLLEDFCPFGEENRPAEHCELAFDDLSEKPAAGKPSGVMAGYPYPERQPLASVAMQNARHMSADADEAKRMRGPERFFYDTSSYTGCARYGGPMIVEKKENASMPAKAVGGKAAGPTQSSTCPQGQVQAVQAKRGKPFLLR